MNVGIPPGLLETSYTESQFIMQFTLNLFLFLSVFTLAVNAVPVVDGFHGKASDPLVSSLA